ncbi:MAG: phosphatidate cytidylyltransferase [Planctomycetota bacterium]|jgi:phosphatidate cytidylyltransferase
MLKHRLLFGALMIIGFGALLILDGLLDGSLTVAAPDKDVQGTLLCILIMLIALPAQLELCKLAAAKNVRIFAPIAAAGSILLATAWYWPQLDAVLAREFYLPVVCALIVPAVLLYQALCCGFSGVLANSGATLFAIHYLGILGCFVMAIRIDFGLWALLMFICTVKSADIGAWAIGRKFGKHKFSPKISPGKTWEGMGGAVGASILVAVLFAVCCDIMLWPGALVFAVSMAFVGQLGDLAESMIKRDAGQKDSAEKVPGFGGILDIVDSPLMTAPFAYLLFMSFA